ncbi:MAG: prepilin peptidase [Chloroflexi bacterium]|nr:prepilin peptidase [Chloroflexota bacterium]
MPDIMVVFVVGLLGVLAGGLVNILADDLPQRRAPRLPRYPDGTLRPALAWLGITAFLLGKHTSPQGARLSWRHPLSEGLTALGMLVALLSTADIANRDTLQLAFWLIYVAIFALVTVIDIEHRLILFVVIIPACLLALVDAAITTATANGPNPNLQDALLGGGLGLIVTFIMYIGGFVYMYLRFGNQETDEVAFGFGDVTLTTFCGLVLGWRPLIFALFLAVFLGAVGAFFFLLVGRLRQGKEYTPLTFIPYGPYIVAGTLIMLLFSSEFSQFLLRAAYG